MAMVKIKGHDINIITVRDSFYRRAIQYSNNIKKSLRKLGVAEDDIEIEVIRGAMKNEPAKVEWYMDGHNMEYSYKLAPKFVENMYAISKVIECQIKDLEEGVITMQDFIASFHEEDDVHDERKEARKLLGLHEDENDMEVINKSYKDLAKKHHPDMDEGCIHKFKEINKAHKVIKRELM